MPYRVYDRKTGATMGTYGTSTRAGNKKDKLDNEYGGYRYGVEHIQAKKKSNKDLKIKNA